MDFIKFQAKKNDTLEIAKGNMPNASPLFVYAYNDDVDRNNNYELWDVKGNYTFSNTADINTVVSDDNSDNGLIIISGLDANYEQVEQFVQLAGTTPVQFLNLLRVSRIRIADKLNTGNITCYIDGGSPFTDADIRGRINAGFGKTHMGIYTVPRGYTAFINVLTARVRRRGSTGDISSTIHAEVRLPNSAFVKEMLLPMHTEGGQQDIRSDNYIKIPEMSDIRIKVYNDSANNGVFSVDFSGILLKGNY